DRPVGRADGDAVETGDDALVLRRIDRLVGLDVVVALAVAVGVENERRPTLRRSGIASRQEFLRVEPTRNRVLRPAGAGPQRGVGIDGELQVMGRKAGVDQRKFLALRVIHCQLAGRFLDRKNLADGWAEPFLQKAGLSSPRMRAVNQTRPSLASTGLFTLAGLFQVFSSPQ